MKRKTKANSTRGTLARRTSKSKPRRSSKKKQSSSSLGRAIVRTIRALPKGKVSSYGAIAEAAGWPRAARQVVRILRTVPGLPWHRVVGSGGAIKLPGENGAEQRFRLRMEGVTFRGERVDMKQHQFRFRQRQSAE